MASDAQSRAGETSIPATVAVKTQDTGAAIFPSDGITALHRLKTNIEKITRSVQAQWGLYIRCMETEEEITLHAYDIMDTMSVIKIPLMIEVFRQAQDGRFSLADRVTLKASHKRPGTGILRYLDEGAVLTIRDLITLMINVSDNSATDLLFEQVGGVRSVNTLMQQYGLTTITATGTTDEWFQALRAEPDTWKFHQEGKHPFGLSSARDTGRLLERILQGEAVSKAASQEMLGMLRSQLYRTRLPRYVEGTVIPHKTGDFLPYIGNDVGILELPKRRVVLCVFTAHHNGLSALLEEAIGRIAEQVNNYFSYQ